MGTWATGPFDNDSAADFADDIRGCTDLDERHDLLLATLRDGSLTVPHADLSPEYSYGYKLEFAIAAAAFVADEHTGVKKFTDNSYARGVGEDMQLMPFVEFHQPSADLLEASRKFIGAMVQRMRHLGIHEEWTQPVDDIRRALA